jgi:hypothetical protein
MILHSFVCGSWVEIQWLHATTFELTCFQVLTHASTKNMTEWYIISVHIHVFVFMFIYSHSINPSLQETKE